MPPFGIQWPSLGTAKLNDIVAVDMTKPDGHRERESFLPRITGGHVPRVGELVVAKGRPLLKVLQVITEYHFGNTYGNNNATTVRLILGELHWQIVNGNEILYGPAAEEPTVAAPLAAAPPAVPPPAAPPEPPPEPAPIPDEVP